MLYPNNLKNWNSGCPKTPGLLDRKLSPISNSGSFTIDQSREFSHQPKSNSSDCLGIKVGLIDYLNALPLNAAFRLGILNPAADLIFGIPTEVNSKLRKKELDISQVSSAEYLEGGHALLPGFGIVSHKKILSVNLYVKENLTSFDDVNIAVTQESMTSVLLLRVICHHFWKVRPFFHSLEKNAPLDSHSAFLLIGDQALINQQVTGYRTIDLAEVWYQATGLPFVFSVFAIRQEVLNTQKSAIDIFHQHLQASLNWGENNRDQILKIATQRCSLSPSLLNEYFNLCRYRIGKKEQEGLNLFSNLSSDVP